MAPLNYWPTRWLWRCACPPPGSGDIIRVERPRAISADTAIRLGRYFGTTPQFWMNLQSAYDLSVVETEKRRHDRTRCPPARRAMASGSLSTATA